MSLRQLSLTAALILLLVSFGSTPGCGGGQSSSTNASSGGSGGGGGGGNSAAIGPTFFGMDANDGLISQQPWPTVSYGSQRLWDSGVSWAEVNTAPGIYDFTALDKWFTGFQANHIQDVLYTFGHTPQFASSNPNDTSCSQGPGQCDPPSDLNPDGTGTDQQWKDFVTAIATHAAGRIKYWETWNEAPNPLMWQGTVAQTIRMAQDARSIILGIDPTALIVSPSSGLRNNGTTWLSAYLSAGGGQYADIIAFHGYVQNSTFGDFPQASDLTQFLTQYKSILASAGQGSKPLWDTEGSWGQQAINGFTDPDLQTAFLAQYHFLHLSNGVQRLYWYQWNNAGHGTLWLPDPNTPSNPGTLLPPGVAYAQVYNWLVGTTLTSPCTATGTVWTCQLTGASGYVAEAIWDTSQSCSAGACSTSNMSVPSQFVKYRDLDGGTTAITGSTVPVGAKPILLENQ
jgi:hypothetical protein